MAKGFKDEDGKFHPTEKKQGISSNDVAGLFDEPRVNPNNADELKKQKGRIKEIRVFKFDELEPDVQEKVIDKNRDVNFYDPSQFTDNDIILDSSIFKWSSPKTFFEVDRNRFIQFTDLEVKDEEKFRKLLDVPEALWKKVEFTFVNDARGETDTKLDFFENDFAGDAGLSGAEEARLEEAKEKFSEIMDDAVSFIIKDIEFLESDEQIIETLEANEREFEEDGSPV